jgi:hypothetical protein
VRIDFAAGRDRSVRRQPDTPIATIQHRRGKRDGGQPLQAAHLGIVERQRQHDRADLHRCHHRRYDDAVDAVLQHQHRVAAQPPHLIGQSRDGGGERAGCADHPAIRFDQHGMFHARPAAQRGKGGFDRRPVAGADRGAEAEVVRQHVDRAGQRLRAQRPQAVIDAAAGDQFGRDRRLRMGPDHDLRGHRQHGERGGEHAGVQNRQSPPQRPETKEAQAHQRWIVSVVA